MNGRIFCLFFCFFCWENRFNWLWLYNNNNMNFYPSSFNFTVDCQKPEKNNKNPIYKTNNRICTVIYEKPERLNINEWWNNQNKKKLFIQNHLSWKLLSNNKTKKSAKKKQRIFFFWKSNWLVVWCKNKQKRK